MKSLVVRTRSSVGDESDLRVFFFENPGELLVALDELWPPLFIAHAHHFEIEGGRMSHLCPQTAPGTIDWTIGEFNEDRKSTRLNSSHQIISYAVFCLKKKKNKNYGDNTL